MKTMEGALECEVNIASYPGSSPCQHEEEPGFNGSMKSMEGVLERDITHEWLQW